MASDPNSLETIDYEEREGVAIVALSRPEKYNAVNRQMHADFAIVLKALARSDARCMLLTGRGRGFCSGQDLTEFGMARAVDGFRVDDYVRETFNRTILGIRNLDMPVVAAVNGVAAGAGWSLALAADIRIAARDATFTQAFTKIGLVPDSGSTWFLPQLVGPARALELAYTGDKIDATRAHEWGLVNMVVEPDELEQHSFDYARRLAQLPTVALGMTRRAIYRATSSTLEDALEYEAQLQQHDVSTADHVEGVMAFLEKRDPVYTGS